MGDLFLSYARAKAEPLARKLYERLTLDSLDVWFDRVSMPSRSLTFLHEIRRAVHEAKRTVVLVDEPAMRSEYVQAEWQYALADGKPVVPLMLLETPDAMPPELRPLHAVKFGVERPFEDAYAELRRKLADPVPELGPLLGEIPGVPPHFQPRTEFATLLAGEVLRGRVDPVTVKGRQRITVVHGMGGSGKSVLAAAFVRSTATRQAFEHGIVWIALDVDAAAEQVMRRIGELMTGLAPTWATRDACVEELGKVLAGKRVLIVLDNAASLDALEPLEGVLETDTRVIATTRRAGLAADLGAQSVYVEDLREHEALRLLADWARVEPDELPPEAAVLAQECGYLPFALAINGSMVRRGMPWNVLLEALAEHELDFAEADQRLAPYPHRNVFRCIRPSVAELERNEPEAAKRLAELPAFFWRDGVPIGAITRYWAARGVGSVGKARKLLVQLADRSLLRLDGGRARLHDIQLDYLIATGSDSVALSRALLEAYRTEGEWARIEPDGYIHENLIRHLVVQGDGEEIERVLDATASDGTNAWFNLVERIDNLAGYLDDLDRSAQAWPERRVHHALMRASINSLSSSVSDEMRVALVRTSSGRPSTPLRTRDRLPTSTGVSAHCSNLSRNSPRSTAPPRCRTRSSSRTPAAKRRASVG